MSDKTNAHFKHFTTPDIPEEEKKDLTVLKELKIKHGRSESDIFYAFLEKMADWSMEMVT